MGLKTLVKVANISNLSDARYCAGMGVEMLGYVATPGHPNYIPPDLFQEIRGWIAGPQTVLIVHDWTIVKSLEELVETYAPDFIETNATHLKLIPGSLTLPLIVTATSEQDIRLIRESSKQTSFVQTDDRNLDLIRRHESLRWFVHVNSSSMIGEVLTLAPVAGISLNGGIETRPGFKDYDELADILDILEED